MDISALDPFRIQESLLAEAYEAVHPQQRAWLKTTQALVQSVFGEAPAVVERRCLPVGSGFMHCVRTVPVSWALVLIGGNFAAPCRLSAALMAARLSGVESVLVFFADDPARVCPAVFAACELAGVENLYALSVHSPSPENLSLLDALITLSPAHGRVLTFGPVHSLPLPFPTWHDAPPTAAIAPDCNLTETQLRDFHPDIILHAPESSEHKDVLYCTSSATRGTTASSKSAALSLGPGLEGAWLHVGLLPSFFQRTSIQLTCTDVLT